MAVLNNKKVTSKIVVIILLISVFLVIYLFKLDATKNQQVMEEPNEPRWLLFHSGTCESCKKMLELSSKLEDEYEGKVDFVDISLDDPSYADIVKQYGVFFIPTNVFEVKGKEPITQVGYIPEKDLIELLDSLEDKNE